MTFKIFDIITRLVDEWVEFCWSNHMWTMEYRILFNLMLIIKQHQNLLGGYGTSRSEEYQAFTNNFLLVYPK